MIFSKKRELRQLKERSDSFRIIKNNRSFLYEKYFIKFLPILYNLFSRLIYSTIHIYDKLILEADISILKKIIKINFKLFEKRI